jgi:hypothetical protein
MVKDKVMGEQVIVLDKVGSVCCCLFLYGYTGRANKQLPICAHPVTCLILAGTGSIYRPHTTGLLCLSLCWLQRRDSNSIAVLLAWDAKAGGHLNLSEVSIHLYFFIKKKDQKNTIITGAS